MMANKHNCLCLPQTKSITKASWETNRRKAKNRQIMLKYTIKVYCFLY